MTGGSVSEKENFREELIVWYMSLLLTASL